MGRRGLRDRRDYGGRMDCRVRTGCTGRRCRRVHTSPISGGFVYLSPPRWASGSTYPTNHTRDCNGR